MQTVKLVKNENKNLGTGATHFTTITRYEYKYKRKSLDWVLQHFERTIILNEP